MRCLLIPRNFFALLLGGHAALYPDRKKTTFRLSTTSKRLHLVLTSCVKTIKPPETETTWEFVALYSYINRRRLEGATCIHLHIHPRVRHSTHSTVCSGGTLSPTLIWYLRSSNGDTRDGSAVKSISCCYRRLEFHF